jgi:phenylalanine-4-hydroxylase
MAGHVHREFTAGEGLTTTKAPYIENAVRNGEIYIEQPYTLYSQDNHDVWQRLYARMQDRWARYANRKFMDGLSTLCFEATRVPRLEDVNRFMAPRTGFRARAVSGFVPAFQFFDCLSRREFPTTVTIRDGTSLDYLPEPDIFHDIAGHVPMHTDPAFADTLVRFGQCAHTAAELVGNVRDEAEQLRRLTSIQNALQRFFWFTVEFGLMRGVRPGEHKAYGSGLLSSYGELAHCIEAPGVQRYPIQMEWVVNQHFEIDHYQPLLFVVNDFDHLFELVGELERWMKDGKLDNVTPGWRDMSEADVKSFLEASRATQGRRQPRADGRPSARSSRVTWPP